MTGIYCVANSTLPWDPLDREVTETNFLRFASATVTRIPDWGRIQGKQVTVAVCSFIHHNPPNIRNFLDILCKFRKFAISQLLCVKTRFGQK
jgi:hypothetical protein